MGVLFLPLQYSIYLGTLSSILFFLYQSSKVNIGYLKLNGSDKFVEHSLNHFPADGSKIGVITIDGDLHFAAAENLAEKVEHLISEEIDVIIFRMRRVRLMASTGVTVLERLLKKAKSTNTRLILSGLSEESMVILQDCGLADEIGLKNIYPATEVPYESTRQALNETEYFFNQLPE
jgi:anti-anti-sigma factor